MKGCERIQTSSSARVGWERQTNTGLSLKRPLCVSRVKPKVIVDFLSDFMRDRQARTVVIYCRQLRCYVLVSRYYFIKNYDLLSSLNRYVLLPQAKQSLHNN